MSTALAYEQPRFLRRTRLQPNEYNKNFRMLDEETLSAVSSLEADAITPLMSKIYLRLLQAPDHCCRGERELHFQGEVRDGKRLKAWDQLCRHLHVSSETAQKALAWMHKQGIIGYSAFKNRVGIFIFLNRAASSIGVRSSPRREKILHFPSASESRRAVSPGDTAFNDPFGDTESLDTNLNPHAPNNGADTTPEDDKPSSPAPPAADEPGGGAPPKSSAPADVAPAAPGTIPVEEIVRQLRSTLEPSLKSVAVQAAREEHARTREWLDKYGIPKATRVAQKEAYNVLRQHGLMDAKAQRLRAELQVGRSSGAYVAPEAGPRTPGEITEVAEMCVALLEVQSKSVEVTLAEISSEAGGWLLPEDVPRVREAARSLLLERKERR